MQVMLNFHGNRSKLSILNKPIFFGNAYCRRRIDW